MENTVKKEEILTQEAVQKIIKQESVREPSEASESKLVIGKSSSTPEENKKALNQEFIVSSKREGKELQTHEEPPTTPNPKPIEQNLSSKSSNLARENSAITFGKINPSARSKITEDIIAKAKKIILQAILDIIQVG